jgi:integrase
MPQRRKRNRSVRHHVGRVSYYLHHGSWWVYYREGKKPVRERIAKCEIDAERIASQINAQLASHTPTLLCFTSIEVPELRNSFLNHHENVLRSSVSTIRRYRAATQHLVDFMAETGYELPAHQIPVDRFAAFLRSRKVAPNGHRNSAKRHLRDKGVRYILQVCRSMYGYAQRRRHLPPYASNPFSEMQIDRMQVEDAKTVFVFSAETELAFLQAADDWAFPIHFILAKTGLRPGELTHLLIEDVDLETGWLHIRNKRELGWQIKTRAERAVPLIPELQNVLQRVIGERKVGLVFLRPRFCSGDMPEIARNRKGMRQVLEERLERASTEQGQELSREQWLHVAHGLWRDAGSVKVDAIRNSFIRITKTIDLSEATCPKSWRHTFATLLQDANVDPLIRQLSLGHKPTGATGALGMTSVYTHTRPETQRREIERALRLWPQSLDLTLRRFWGNENCH